MPTYEEDDRVGEVTLSGRPLSVEERLQVKQVLDLEQEFISCLDLIAKQKGGNTRCLSLAKTHMQQARMWAVEGLIRDRPSG